MGSIALIGAGNVGQAIAGHMALIGHDVRIYDRWGTDLEPIRENDGIDLVGDIEGHGRPRLLTTNLQEAVQGAEVIVVAAPAFAHASISAGLAEVVEPEQLVVFQPGVLGSGVEFLRMLAQVGRKRSLVAETATSLYTCRLRGPANVYIGAIKQSIGLAAVPSSDTAEVLDILVGFFGERYISGDALTIGLSNSNAIYHVPPSILNFKTVEDADSRPLHSLVTPRIAEVIDALDQERIALAHALGISSPSFWDFLESAYGVVEGSHVEKIIQGYGRQGFPEPDSIDHRYFTEDIPFGLVTWRSLAHEVNLSLPLTEAFIRLGSTLCNQDFIVTGRTAQSLGLEGVGARGIRRAFLDGEL